MFQGQIAYLEATTGLRSPGWYVKLRSDGNAIAYYPLNGGLTLDPIDVNDVDETDTHSHPDRPYRVVESVPAEAQVRYTRFEPPANFLNQLAGLRQTAEIRQRVQQLRNIRVNYNGRSLPIEEAYAAIQDEIDELHRIEERAINGTLRYLYVYAHHPGNPTEYCWLVPPTFTEEVGVGDRVMVDTAQGRASVVIERTEESTLRRNVRSVLSVVSHPPAIDRHRPLDNY